MDRVWHLAIPSLLSALGGIAVLSRYVRSQMLEVISQDYVRTARAKGLPEDDVVYHHALRNALLPFVTMFGFLLPGPDRRLGDHRADLRLAGSRPARLRRDPDARLPGDPDAQLHRRGADARRARFVSDVLYAVVDPRIRLG